MTLGGSHTRRVARGARWPRSRTARLVGDALLWIACRIHDRWLRLEVVHGGRAAAIPLPSLIVFNYPAPYAALAVLRTIPRRLRHRVAVAADADAWSRDRRWQGALIALAIQAFPMARGGRGVRASLEEAARWLAEGYAVLIAPEGGPSMSEEPGAFLGGVGLLATRLGVPIVPFRIEGYAALYPVHDVPFPWLPRRSDRARVIVGEAIAIPPGMSAADATEMARRAVLALEPLRP